MNTLYLECFSGISGDMTVAALMDLGADASELIKIIDAMNLGCVIYLGRALKNGISACDFDVKLSDELSEEHMERGLNDIIPIIDKSLLSDNAKVLAKKMFYIVAEAESKVHDKPIEEVHFHEVGAVDSIVDICAAAYCIDNLKIQNVICSKVCDGKGYIMCQHGILPVPVPATTEISKRYGIPLKITNNDTEMVTPTGAAILAAIVTEYKDIKNMVFEKSGIGAGKKDFKNANILKASLIDI